MKHMTMKLKPAAHRCQEGFSLVELMVALVIGLLILAGLLVAFSGNRATYRFNDQMMQIQEAGRFAMDTIREDLRMASYAGCNNIALDKAVDISGASDPIEERIWGSDGILEEFEYTPTEENYITNGLINGINNGTGGDDKTLRIFMPIDSGPYGLFSDCSGNKLARISKPPAAPPAATPAEQAFHIQATLGWKVYKYTADKITTEVEDLSAADPLVENVEAFGFCVAKDGNMDGQLDPAGFIHVPSSADEEFWRDVVAVQVSFVISSRDDVLDAPTTVNYTYCGNGNDTNTFTATDRKLHRQFTSVTTLRNKMANGYGRDMVSDDYCYRGWAKTPSSDPACP
jgi:type IV pilus assembly protein PilW